MIANVNKKKHGNEHGVLSKQLRGVLPNISIEAIPGMGNVIQEREKTILVEQDSQLLELARYVALNPELASMVSRPGKTFGLLRGAIPERNPAMLIALQTGEFTLKALRFIIRL